MCKITSIKSIGSQPIIINGTKVAEVNHVELTDTKQPIKKTKAQKSPKAKAAPKAAPKAEVAPKAPKAAPYRLVVYSEKSFAIFGETKAIKEQLKAIGGRFNRFLHPNGQEQPEAGWIFCNKARAAVDKLLATI